MLRINLLPSYVGQRRLTKRLAAVFAVLFLLSVVAPLSAYFVMQKNLTEIAQEADDAEAGKAKTDALKTQATTTLAQVKPIQDKLDFVTAVHAYAVSWVKLYNTLADTSPRSSLIYTDASVSGSTMTIKAYSPSVAEVGRYLQAIYNEPDFQTVSVDKVPGYPDNVRHLYYLNGKMVFADGATGSADSGGGSSGGYPGGGSSSYSGSSGGYPGSSGGYSSSSQSGGQSSGGGAPAGYSPANLAPNGPGNVPSGVGPPPPELTGGASAPGGAQGSYPGGSGGQASGGYSPAFLKIADANTSPFAPPQVVEAIRKQYLRRVVTKLAPKGFDITVTATLKQPLTPPGLPGSPSAAPGRGGPSGSPGGYPGGPPPGGPRPA